MSKTFDLAIVGSGFGGSILALIAQRLGLSVLLLEKSRHPRFAMGESSTPLANLLLEEISKKYDLPRLAPLAKWGSWRKNYPEISCGLKRGFTFYHHQFGVEYQPGPDHHNQLLVAASPHDRIADTHWYRADLDHFLFREARREIAACFEGVRLHRVEKKGGVVCLHGQDEKQSTVWRAKFLVDATGPRGFLHHALKIPERKFKHLPATQGLYTHFQGVERWQEIYPEREPPPYPVDDAALHHVFDGGWIWVLRFSNGLTSAGVAAEDWLARALNLAEGAAAWKRLMKRLPSVARQFAHSKPSMDFVYSPALSYQSKKIVGPWWAMLPSAAGFIDPLLSTGFPLTLLGISRLATILEKDWGKDAFEPALVQYAVETRKELLAAEQLVSALYANMNDFSLFAALSLLYFAASSFEETTRRLERPQKGSFLLQNNARFAVHFHACCRKARKPLTAPQRDRLLQKIYETIQPVDVAGLSNPARRNWFPVEAADLFGAASKLRASRLEIQSLLDRCGFTQV